MKLRIGRSLTILALIASATGIAAASCVEPGGGSRVEMYPTSQELPSNLLRIYLYFAYPVHTPDALKHVMLKGADGREIDGVFLPSRYDLWSPDRRRLTLLLDPGRVKTGLQAHETHGRALTIGEENSHIVDEASLRAKTCEQDAVSVFKFSVTAPDYDPPKPGEWRITLPKSGTTEPLIVDLGSPHDHVSLAFRLRVTDGQDAIVPGSVDLRSGETIWTFTPSDPWSGQAYTIAIDEMLEDLAGNRPDGVFARPAGDANLNWSREIPWRAR